MSEMITGSAYLVIRGTRRFGKVNAATGLRPVREIKILSVRQGRPQMLEGDEVVIKLTLQLPTSIFDPLMPEAAAVITEDMVVARGPIYANAEQEGAADTPDEQETD